MLDSNFKTKNVLIQKNEYPLLDIKLINLNKEKQ